MSTHDFAAEIRHVTLDIMDRYRAGENRHEVFAALMALLAVTEAGTSLSDFVQLQIEEYQTAEEALRNEEDQAAEAYVRSQRRRAPVIV